MRRGALTLLALAGCGGWSEEEFLTEGVGALCDAIAACEDLDADACVDVVRSGDFSGCAFDPEAAHDCVDELEVAACEPHVATGRDFLQVPPRCDEVYAGCDPLWVEPYVPAF